MAVPWQRSARLDADAVDYFARIAAVGGGLQNGAYSESGTKRRLSDFFVSLKDSGVWQSISDMGIFLGVSDLPACLVKAKYPAGTAAMLTNYNFVSGDHAPVGGASGLKGDGATKYLGTGVNQNTLPQNSASFWVYVSNPVNTATLEAFIGTNAGANKSVILKENTNLMTARVTGTAIINTNLAVARGLIGINRTGASNVDWRVGASAASGSNSSGGVNSIIVSVFAREGLQPTSSAFAMYGFGTAIDLAALKVSCDSVFANFGGTPS